MIEDFYTTPQSLLEKLLDGIRLDRIKSILDVGAGKGDIVDFICNSEFDYSDYFRNEFYTYKKKFGKDSFDIDTIEINPELQHILRGKGYKVIHDDFLTYNGLKQYDLIIGNFPFSIGAGFLQKALFMIEENGGTLRCIINAETLKNPCTKTRQWCVNKLRDLCADVQFLDGEFLHAERQTNVSIALISVSIEVEQNGSLILDALQKAAVIDAETAEPSAMVEQDFYKQIVSSFDMECRACLYLIKEYFALKPNIRDRITPPKFDENGKPLPQPAYSRPILELKVEGENSKDTLAEKLNKTLRLIRKKYWEIFIDHLQNSGKYTSNVITILSNKLNELKDYDFTLFNIREVEKDLDAKINEGVHDAILKMFDEFSGKHSYRETPEEENIHYYNGWKTNKAWKINHKIILPINGVSATYGSWDKGPKDLNRHSIEQKLSDMVTVFNTLASQGTTDARQLVGNQIHFANQRKDYNLDLRYFEVKFYKKGTCHIKFKNQILLDKLNIYGSQRKNWLPPSYGKVSYEQMNTEEKAVIDEFQGKEAYEKVCANSQFYFVGDSQLQLTTSL